MVSIIQLLHRRIYKLLIASVNRKLVLGIKGRCINAPCYFVICGKICRISILMYFTAHNCGIDYRAYASKDLRALTYKGIFKYGLLAFYLLE